MMEKKDKPSYSEKTERIKARALLFRSLTVVIWIAVVLIIAATIGRSLLSPEISQKKVEEKTVIVREPIDWRTIDPNIVQVIMDARQISYDYASDELDGWIDQLKLRIDDDFLEWYFGYINQQLMGLKALWQMGKNKIMMWKDDSDKITPEEAIMMEVQEEFANRVLKPEVSQKVLERITKGSVTIFVEEVGRGLESVRAEYSVSKAMWDEHLMDISSLTTRHEGLRETDLSLKAIVTVSVAGGTATVLAAKKIAIATGKLATKVSSKLAGKSAVKMASKTGGKVAAKVGGKFLGPIIGVAIIIWDAIDHKATKAKNLPVLRESLFDFLDELKLQLLSGDESSVIWVVDDFVEDYAHALSYEQQAE